MTGADAAADGPAIPSTAASDGSAPPATKGGKKIGRRPTLQKLEKTRSKYNAKGEKVNGVWMASATQAERYRQLLWLEKGGVIGNLRVEVPFHLTVNNRKICTYRLDFLYDVLDERGHELRTVHEEVKGFITPEYRLKKKLFEAVNQVTISEIFCNSAKRMHAEWNNRIPES